MKHRTAPFRIIAGSVPTGVLLILLVSSAAMVILSFAVPLTVLQTYDRIIAYGSLSTLTWLTLGCLAALSLNALMEYWRASLASWTAQRFLRGKDEELMATMLAATPETLARDGPERHLERLRSLGGIAQSLLGRALPALAEAPFAAGYLAILIFMAGWAATPAIVAAGAELALALAARPYRRSLLEAVEASERRRTRYIAYVLERLHFIKAQALEHAALQGFDAAQGEATGAEARRMALDQTLDETGRIVGGAATFGTIIAGGVLVARGSLTVGTVSAALFFASRLVGSARELRRTLFLLSDTRADLEELEAGLAIPRHSGAGEPRLPRGIQGRLEFAEVSYCRQPGSRELVAALSFVVRPGESALVVGEGAEGRSAVCRLAAGMVAPNEGEVFVDAYPSSRWDFRSSGGEIGYVSDRSGVLPGSILENVASFDPARMDGALNVAQLFGLDVLVSRLPRGFETRIGPGDPGGLSASALRLVTVARALALRPRMLVWDGADADLDGDSRELVLGLLRELRGATTLVLNSDSPAFRGIATFQVGGPALREASL